MLNYSVLDLAPVCVEKSPIDTFKNSADLARHAENLGYQRYWLAEHHNMPGIASSATSVVIGYIASQTKTIRVGAGGIMLPNHSPLIIAEQFGTLASMYPNRIDLGLGRAPGSDMRTARALRRDMHSAESFPQDVAELRALLSDDEPTQGIHAVPGQGTNVPHKADSRCFGMAYLKIRRSGFSFMGSSECVNTGTLAKDSRVGILSKTGSDAKKMFTDKVVPIANRLPFFFKPIQDGMDKPKTELAFRVPASKITKKNMYDIEAEEILGLDTTIDWKNTDDNSYDGEKLLLLVHDESGKWIKPNNILNNWRVTKTCLRLGSKIIGKCLMGSTSNALAKGGANFKKLYEDSHPLTRNANGQTKSGMYSLFIPMEYNMEGFIDQYGHPVFNAPEKPVKGVDGEMIKGGAIDYWEAEVESMKSDPDALNEFYRQFPRTESHAFRDESKQSLFNLTKIYQQIDYADSLVKEHYLTRGSFSWENGIKDSKVIFRPDRRGRFNISWTPNKAQQNRVVERRGIKYAGNEHLGSFGCDSYDISGTVGGGGSNGALHGMTKFHMDDAPTNEFFLEYVARPQTAEIFFEEVLMACVFYGMPILIENNKPRLLYHFKNRGYRGFCMNRPDKQFNKLSKTERELGGIPNSSEDVKQAHAAAIESYIEKHIGVDMEGTFRDTGEMGTMPFVRTLEDWARFDISNRTAFDATISSGLAVMANQKHLYMPEQKKSSISINLPRYNNRGFRSERLD